MRFHRPTQETFFSTIRCNMFPSTESTPLSPFSNHRRDFLSSLHSTFSETVRISQPLLTCLLALTLVQVRATQFLISALTLLFAETQTEQPLKWWLVGCMLQDLLYLIYAGSKLPKLSKALDLDATLEVSFWTFAAERVVTG